MSAKLNEPYQKDPWEDVDLHKRERLQPAREMAYYLHLVDLNAFVQRYASLATLTILDYGAGASPYRQYFPNADYRRADLEGVGNLTYIIQPDSTIKEGDDTFDLILSTQVAEHVPNPDAYFQECYRMLRKGGRLILTTHGILGEHGVPYDFQRWTSDGIRRDLTRVGFQKMEVFKLTCNLRAALTISTQILLTAPNPTSPLKRFFLKSVRWTYRRSTGFLNSLGDRLSARDRIQRVGDEETPAWYIDVAAVAEK